jgi:5-methylcytosine-specific restriction enzyme subunit McrC
MAVTIPIQNLYYLFCYAWDRFPEGKALTVGTEESPEPLDLFAKVLINGIERLLRRGLDQGYCEHEEETSSIRGRIVLNETLRRNLLQHARAFCRFDELQRDVPHNQIIKATARRLSLSGHVHADHAHRLRVLCRQLDGISDVKLSRELFRRVQLSRNTAHYDLLLKICRLLKEDLLPRTSGEGARFADILKDEERMSAVYEAFVRNFYRREQSEFSAGSELISWDATAPEQEHAAYLPMMRTDVTLRSAAETIVIDTKYYRKTLSSHMGSEKIWSSHLYQIFSYLKNLERAGGNDAKARGILLYPTVGKALDARY